MRALDDRDELFEDAVRIIQETGRGSVSLLQRKLRIGYNRAGRLVEQLEEAGYLGPDRGGSHGRKVLIGAPKPSNVTQSSEAESDQVEHNNQLPTPRIIGGSGEDDDGQGTPRVWM